MRPILQVALDFIELERAIQAARESVDGGADWIEAGTPLIKSVGMDAVRALKKNFPKHIIVADMKTIDTGRIEVEMAAKSGADIILILGVSDEATIRDAVEAGKNYGAKIMVDLLGVQDKIEYVKKLEDLSVDYICIHTSIDAQMIGKNPFNELIEITKNTSLPVAVAGGINSENVVEAINENASIIIIGGAIIKSADIKNATKKIKDAMCSGKPIKTEIKKYISEKELYEVFSKVTTCNITDAMHRKGSMKNIKPLTRGYKIVGRALTVKTIDGDWAKTVEAIEKANKGDVIVIDAGNGNKAVWGELASWSCKMKGIAGVVIDGCCRDIDTIIEINFPVFCREIAPDAGEPKGYGEISVEITCCGQTVRPMDWIIGDDNGVVVVQKEKAIEIANRAIDVYEKENRIREEIKRGKVLSVVMELEKWEKTD